MLDSSLAQYGRSKERRSDCPLVSVGLLTNEWGFIRRSHFYAGNVSEPGTLEQIVTYLRDSQGVLTDAGIGTTDNIEELALRGVGYMCVVPAGFNEYEVDFSQAAEFEHQTSNGQRYKVWLQVEEHSFRVGQQPFRDWLIFVKSEAKQAKEDGIISKQKQRMEAGLDQIRQSLSNPRGHRKIHQVHQRIGRLKLQNSKVSKAFDIQTHDDGVHVTQLQWRYNTRYEQRNGTYIIRTSEPVTDARQAWQVYHTLSTIEGVNRCCKTDLNMRPVYHRKDEPIQAHLFLTLLACTIVTYIRHLLGKKRIYWSWKEIVRILSTQKSILSEFRNKQGELFLLSKWSEPEPKALAIYQALGYKIRRSPGFFFKIAADDP
jgi:transposase